MRKMIMLFVGVTIAAGASAQSAEDLAYSSEVGVQTIARTVIEKELVAKEGQETLMLALETGKARFGIMQCERGLGVDDCSVDVFVADDETTPETETMLYKLEVRIYQGKVSSAVLNKVGDNTVL